MTTPGLVWTLDRTRTSGGRGRPPRVSEDDVVRTAIEILDGEGVDALTMRALAERLDVGVGTVYSHLPSREAVLDLACDAALASLPDWHAADRDWLVTARAYLDALRELSEKHQWWPILYPYRPLIGPNGLRLREQFLDLLDGAGFAFAELEPVMMSLTHMALGTMLIENTWRIWPTRSQDEVDAVKQHLLTLGDGHPLYGGIVSDYIAVTDPDEVRDMRWRTAVDSMLAGLQTRLLASTRDV